MTKKKKILTIILVSVIVFIASSMVTSYRINSVDLYSGKICQEYSICHIPIKKEVRDTPVTKILSKYQISSNHAPEWHPDSEVATKIFGLGVIKTGGRIQSSLYEASIIIEIANTDDQHKKDSLIQLMTHLQNKEFDNLIDLAKELSRKY